MPPALVLQLFGQAPPDLIQDQTHKRLGAADVGGRHDQVERDGVIGLDEIPDAPVAAPRDGGDDGISIQAEERHRRRQHAAAFVLALVEQLACRAGDHGMNSLRSQMRRCHHRPKGLLDRTLGIREEVGDAGERLVLLGVENVQDGSYE